MDTTNTTTTAAATLTDRQAEAVELYLNLCARLKADEIRRGRCMTGIDLAMREDAWSMCRALGVVFMANGSVEVRA